MLLALSEMLTLSSVESNRSAGLSRVTGARLLKPLVHHRMAEDDLLVVNCAHDLRDDRAHLRYLQTVEQSAVESDPQPPSP